LDEKLFSSRGGVGDSPINQIWFTTLWHISLDSHREPGVGSSTKGALRTKHQKIECVFRAEEVKS
jgi:hypothetical protein